METVQSADTATIALAVAGGVAGGAIAGAAAASSSTQQQQQRAESSENGPSGQASSSSSPPPVKAQLPFWPQGIIPPPLPAREEASARKGGTKGGEPTNMSAGNKLTAAAPGKKEQGPGSSGVNGRLGLGLAFLGSVALLLSSSNPTGQVGSAL